MHHLPVEVTSFVGRDDELTAVGRFLATSRLVTLTGPAGVGKTRLALRAAKVSKGEFPDGLWLVRLDVLRDPRLLAHTVAVALGLSDSTGDATTRIVGFLADKTALVVLDNCEHLADACAAFVANLVSATANVRILATSRHTLGVQGEQLLSVPPLDIHDIQASHTEFHGDAVTLFTDRARSVNSDFVVDDRNRELVTRICARLDGIPLAIELAVMCLRVLSLDDVLGRLDDVHQLLTQGSRASPSRHQTLRAAIAWSHDLCSPAEARLWERLSIFAGGFSLTAARAVCLESEDDSGDLLELFVGLVDKSILIREDDQPVVRYRMLETLRQFGLRKLVEAGEEIAVRRRHRDLFLTMTSRMAAEWFGPDQLDLVARTRQEYANIRSALDFALGYRDEAVLGVRLAIALEYYWLNCGCFGESVRWLDRALAIAGLPTGLRVNAMWIRVHAATALGDAAKAAVMAAEAVALARTLDDPLVLGNALLGQAGAAMVLTDYAWAEDNFRECVESYERAGRHSCNVVLAHTCRGMSAGFAGSPPAAAEHARRAIEIADSRGEQCVRSYALYSLALAEWQSREFRSALRRAREGLLIKSSFGDVQGQAIITEICAWIVADMGDATTAATLLGVADRMWFRAGGVRMLDSNAWRVPHHNCEQKVRVALGVDDFQGAFDEGAALTTDLPRAVEFVVKVEVNAAAPAAPIGAVLTRREAQIAALIAEGATNRAIAEDLRISRRTVDAHVQHILEKLGFSSRTQIGVWVVAQRDKPA